MVCHFPPKSHCCVNEQPKCIKSFLCLDENVILHMYRKYIQYGPPFAQVNSFLPTQKLSWKHMVFCNVIGTPIRFVLQIFLD